VGSRPTASTIIGTRREKQMTDIVRTIILPRLAEQIGRGNTEALTIIKRRVAESLGGEIRSWSWKAEGENIILFASR
jgi:hypothetical protein